MIKPILWVASTKSDLISMPNEIRDEIGHALFQAQKGEKSDKAKPLKGFGSASVLEIIESDRGGTYRAVYTVKFRDAIAVLHIFKKKSKRGIETTIQDVNLIRSRLIIAEQKYEEWLVSKRDL